MSRWQFRDEDAAHAALLQAGAIEDLETRLRDGFKALPEGDTICRIALALRPEHVVVSGWEAMNTQIAALSRQSPITAVGVDLSCHGDGEDANGWRIQTLETSYYADTRSFAFSTATPEAVREACDESTSPWSGDFVDIDEALTVTGVSELYHTLVHREAELSHPVDADTERAIFLGGWLRHLRVHQALARGLAEHGLARPIPLIVGAHDLTPYVTVPYWPGRVADYELAADRALSDKAARNKAHYAKITEDAITEWRERRETVLGWPRHVNPKQRANHIDFAKAHENVQRMDFPDLQGLPYSFEGSEADFAYLTALFRHLRHPEEPRPTPPPRTWRTILFGR